MQEQHTHTYTGRTGFFITSKLTLAELELQWEVPQKAPLKKTVTSIQPTNLAISVV